MQTTDRWWASSPCNGGGNGPAPRTPPARSRLIRRHREADAGRDRRRSIDELFEQIPDELRLDRPLGAAGRPDRVRGLRRAGGAGGAQRATPTRRSASSAPGCTTTTCRRSSTRSPALGVPDPVHALPAGGLAGRPAGDVRVPDRDVGADRAAGLQRGPLRGALVGRLGRLPGDGATGRKRPGRLARPAPAQPRDARDLRSRLRRRGRRGRPRRRPDRRRRRSRRRSTRTPPPSSSRTRTSSARSRTSRRSAQPPRRAARWSSSRSTR